jgi:hypothetical protein
MKVFNIAILAATVGSLSNAFAPASVKAASRPNNMQRHMFGKLFSTNTGKYPIMAEEAAMSQKAHGTSDKPVQKKLRWNCDFNTADRICNFNRHYAEHGGYWQETDFLKTLDQMEQPIKFYDSVTGVLLFTAPIGRSMDDFVKESLSHGWPSFRDQECNWDDVRCLKNGECISTTGTHLVRSFFLVCLRPFSGLPHNKISTTTRGTICRTPQVIGTVSTWLVLQESPKSRLIILDSLGRFNFLT